MLPGIGILLEDISLMFPVDLAFLIPLPCGIISWPQILDADLSGYVFRYCLGLQMTGLVGIMLGVLLRSCVVVGFGMREGRTDCVGFIILGFVFEGKISKV